MAWKFLSIGKANQEIERLRAENDKLQQEKSSASASPPVAEPPKAEADDDMIKCEACNGTGNCAECSGQGKCTECSGEGKIGANAVGTAKGALAKANAALDDANVNLSKANASLDNFKAALAGKDQEIKALNEKLASKDGEVKVKVSRALADAQAQLGHPALPGEKQTTTGTTQANGATKTGLDKILAAAKADLAAAGYQRKSN